MICENIKNRKEYASINEHFIAAFNFLENTDLNSLSVGKYEVDQEGTFALVQEYGTEAFHKKPWEAHKRYIDIQYILQGEEIIGYYPVKGLELIEDKLLENDVAFYKDLEGYSALLLGKGDYAIFFPEDAHKPGCQVSGETLQVKKVVVKVPVK